MKDRKNVVIAALLAALVALGAVVAWDRLPEEVKARLGVETPARGVKVFDVALDRDGLRFVDLVFDRPLGEGKAGHVLEREPATIRPKIEGAWKWRDAFALRFEPQGPFSKATEYEIELRADRLLPPGERFEKDSVAFATDRFKVTRADVAEEPAADASGGVVLRGRVEFNYPVDPDHLISKMRLIDPLAGEARPVPIGVDIHYWSQAVEFRSDPVKKEKQERELRLVILSDLQPADGNVPLGSDFVEPIRLGSSERLTLWDVQSASGDPESTIRLRFSSPVSKDAVERALTVEPKVDYRVAVDRADATLTGAFAPGGDYALTLAAGLAGEDGASLKEAATRAVSFQDLPPSVAFQSPGQFLAAGGARAVAVESVNAPALALTIHRVYLNNLFLLFSQFSWEYRSETSYWAGLNHALGDAIAEEPIRIPVRAARNKKAVTRVDLGGHLPKGDRGLYRVDLRRAGDDRGAVRWLLLTDLGVVAKTGEGEAFAWVTSVADQSPVPDARVRLVSDQNQVLAEGRTDARGFFHARGLAREGQGRPFMMTVERGEDFTFVLFDQMRIETAGLDVGGASAPAAGYEAYLYGERDLYRPGETARGVAIVRDRLLAAPPSMPLVLRHRDSTGLARESVALASDARGFAAFEHAIPPYARTGGHGLELLVADEVIGTYRFQVEEFVPDRIKVALAPEGPPPAAGGELRYEVACDYLFGPPCAGLPVETRVRLEAAPFAPKGFEGFVFGDSDRKFDAREVFFEQGMLGEDGKATYAARIPDALAAPAALSALVSARVREHGGRGMNAQYRMPVHPVPYYLGLRRPSAGYAEPEKPVTVEWAAVAPGGEAAAAGALRAEFFAVRWNTTLRRTPAGSWRYESSREMRSLASRTLDAGETGGSLTFTPPGYGSYAVALTDPATGAAARIEFYASGWGYAPWAIENPSRVELDLDKDEYAPGERAVVQVRAPFAGKLLLAVERGGLYDVQAHDLAGNTAKVEIPIRAEMRPNAYVTAAVVRGPADLEPGESARAFGAAPLFVGKAAGRLAPKIAAPEETRPNEQLAVEIATEPGAVVTVAAVDEGILQLVAQKTPNPFDHFYRKLALGAATFDTYALLLPELGVEGAAPKGGGEPGGGMESYVRTEGIRRVRPVAFWSGALVADEAGVARATFDLPNFQGLLRLMAVATLGDRFGSAERFTRVRDPLVLLPTFPRFLSFGETAEIPVSVRNDTGADAKVRTTLAAEGPAKIDGAAAKELDVPNAKERALSFTVKTEDREGALAFTLSASGGGETARAEETLAVRPDLFPITVEKSGALAEATTVLAFEGADAFRPGSASRVLQLGTTPLVRLGGKLRDLVAYPYGCLEQTTSAAFPLLYLADLARDLEPDLFEKEDPAARVQGAVRRVAALQLAGGAFSMWPGWEDATPWGSAYATHFLVEAKRAGYPVPAASLKRALEGLAQDARSRGAYEPGELERVVYDLYVLARAGEPEYGAMDVVRSKHRSELRPQSRALLAAAFAATGDAGAIAQLAQGVEDVEAVERETGRNFASTVRDRALLMLAILDAAPEDPRLPKLADRLARDAEIGPWTTQETAFALLALGQFHRRQATLPPIEGKLYAGDRLLDEIGAKTRAYAIPEGEAPVKIAIASGFRPGRIYYALRTRGVPTDAAFAPASAGLEIERTILDRKGAAADLGRIAQGDLLVIKTRVRSVTGAVDNVAIVNLLPSGLEVENPRLEGGESLPWLTGAATQPTHLDLRDDRILLFTDLPKATWRTYYALARAVTPGVFRLPPAHVEAMYDPAMRATSARGTLTVLAPK